MNKVTTETKKEQTNPKKIIITVFCVVILLMGLMYLALEFLNEDDIADLFIKDEGIDLDKELHQMYFYEADYTEDIFQDTEYMNLSRYISYREGSVTYAILEEDYHTYGEEVVFVSDYINSIILGDSEKYYSMFYDDVFKDSDKKDFTMQKLYNITITRYSNELLKEGSATYTEHKFIVEYMIMENNGTFSRIVGSDGIKPLMVTFDDKNGALKISKVETYLYSY